MLVIRSMPDFFILFVEICLLVPNLESTASLILPNRIPMCTLPGTYRSMQTSPEGPLVWAAWSQFLHSIELVLLPSCMFYTCVLSIIILYLVSPWRDSLAMLLWWSHLVLRRALRSHFSESWWPSVVEGLAQFICYFVCAGGTSVVFQVLYPSFPLILNCQQCVSVFVLHWLVHPW